MKKALLTMALAVSAMSAQAGPAVDFSSAVFTGGQATFNAAQTNFYTPNEVNVLSAVYSGGTTLVSGGTYLWTKDGSNEHGFGVCSGGTGASNECYGFSTTDNGNGAHNELDNNGTDEIIGVWSDSGDTWTDVWLSSLDSSENARVYWSNAGNPNLDALDAAGTYVDVAAGYWGVGIKEGSILGALNAGGWDPTADFLWFRAGPSGTDNDYLVWGVSTTAVPEPESYAMLLAGLGLLGLVSRRRKRKQTA